MGMRSWNIADLRGFENSLEREMRRAYTNFMDDFGLMGLDAREAIASNNIPERSKILKVKAEAYEIAYSSLSNIKNEYHTDTAVLDELYRHINDMLPYDP